MEQPLSALKGNNEPSEYEDRPQRLRMCSKGCGRKFKADYLKKHEKICRKVNAKAKVKDYKTLAVPKEAKKYKTNNNYQDSK